MNLTSRSSFSLFFDTHSAAYFFEKNPCTHIQFEFFYEFPATEIDGDILSEISKMIKRRVSAGVPLKFCLRASLRADTLSHVIVNQLLELKQIDCEKRRINSKGKPRNSEEEKMQADVSMYLGNAENEIFRLLRKNCIEYIKLLGILDISKEDDEYYYKPFDSELVFNEFKKLATENPNPIMCFLCAAPDIYCEKQEVLFFVTV